MIPFPRFVAAAALAGAVAFPAAGQAPQIVPPEPVFCIVSAGPCEPPAGTYFIVSFDVNSSYFNEEAAAVLQAFAEAANRPENLSLRYYIDGHANSDSVDDEVYNVWMAQNRANRVREYLISQGVSADRLVARWFGTRQPLGARDNPANRRVEGTVMPIDA